VFNFTKKTHTYILVSLEQRNIEYFRLQEVKGVEKKKKRSEIKVLYHHLPHKPQTMEKIRQQVPQFVFRKLSWLVVTLEEVEEEKKKKQALHFSLALVVKITCASISLVNCGAFSPF